mgnify:CR=1 FL=1
MKKNLLFVLALLPFAASAQKIDPCVTKGNAQEMSACAKDEYTKSQADLKKTYASLLKQIPDKDEDGIPYKAVKKQLEKAEKAWAVFVEEDCKSISIYNRGSALKDIEYYNCMRSHTEQRTGDLGRFVRKPKS